MVMVQEYLSGAESGDKRVLILNGKVLNECIQKLPAEHNFKFAEHSDKYFRKTALTQKEKLTALDIAQRLAQTGIYSAGLDVINEKVIEINITSPCYFIREINQHYGIKFEDKIMKCFEELIQHHFESAAHHALI